MVPRLHGRLRQGQMRGLLPRKVQGAHAARQEQVGVIRPHHVSKRHWEVASSPYRFSPIAQAVAQVRHRHGQHQICARRHLQGRVHGYGYQRKATGGPELCITRPLTIRSVC